LRTVADATEHGILDEVVPSGVGPEDGRVDRAVGPSIETRGVVVVGDMTPPDVAAEVDVAGVEPLEVVILDVDHLLEVDKDRVVVAGGSIVANVEGCVGTTLATSADADVGGVVDGGVPERFSIQR